MRAWWALEHQKVALLRQDGGQTGQLGASPESHARSREITAHSRLSSGLATVNALSQSIFEYRRPEKRSTNRFTPATAVKHAKKIETKNENVSSEKPVFGLKKRCRRVVGKWTKSPKKLNGSPS